MTDILKLRRAVRMSQVELANRAQISRPRLSAAENNYIQLEQDELLKVISVLAEEPSRCAAQIRELIEEASCEQSRFAGKNAEKQKPPRSPLNFNCQELGWVLVKHWQENDYPVMGSLAVAVAAADAVKKAAENWQCTPQEAAERIKAKQELWLQCTLGKSDTPKPAHWWYRDGYWLNTPEEWERQEANLTGKNSKSRADELETESGQKSGEVPAR